MPRRKPLKESKSLVNAAVTHEVSKADDDVSALSQQSFPASTMPASGQFDLSDDVSQLQQLYATSGATPNLFWRTLTSAQLTAAVPGYFRLPNSQPPDVHGRDAYRFLRQGSEPWTAAHSGMLSTGMLREALGFKEPAAAKAMGCAGQAGHSGVVQCYKNLHEALQHPLTGWYCASPRSRQSSATSAACVPPAAVQPTSSVASDDLSAERVAISFASVMGDCVTSRGQLRRSACASAARGGLQAVRKAWGNSQEAAALYCLAQLFPHATLHEVGLYCLHSDDLPACWDFKTAAGTERQKTGLTTMTRDAGSSSTTSSSSTHSARGGAFNATTGKAQGSRIGASAAAAISGNGTKDGPQPLPPLGASPDGVLCHHISTVSVTDHSILCDLLWLAQHARRGDAASAASATSSESVSHPMHDTSMAEMLRNKGAGSVLQLDQAGVTEGARRDAAAVQSVNQRVVAALKRVLADVVVVVPDPQEEHSCSTGADSCCKLCKAAERASNVLTCSVISSGDVETAAAPTVRTAVVSVKPRILMPAALSDKGSASCGGSPVGLCTDGSTAAESAVSACRVSACCCTGSCNRDDSDAARLDEAGSLACYSMSAALSPAAAVVQVSDASRCGRRPCHTMAASAATACAPSAAATVAATAVPQLNGNEGSSEVGTQNSDSFSAGSSHQSAGRTACGVTSSQPGGVTLQAPHGRDTIPASFLVREVVEIKNTVPFGTRMWRAGHKGHARYEYVLSDPGPRDRVEPHWVPQLQLHMVAAGCWSGLLVSRSATKGMSVFRLFRDDEYLRRMLRIVSRFMAAYVLTGIEPPHNMFSKDAEYQSFLQHTVRLSRTATLVVRVPAGDAWTIPPGSDAHAFLA